MFSTVAKTLILYLTVQSVLFVLIYLLRSILDETVNYCKIRLLCECIGYTRIGIVLVITFTGRNV